MIKRFFFSGQGRGQKYCSERHLVPKKTANNSGYWLPPRNPGGATEVRRGLMNPELRSPSSPLGRSVWGMEGRESLQGITDITGLGGNVSLLCTFPSPQCPGRPCEQAVTNYRGQRSISARSAPAGGSGVTSGQSWSPGVGRS